MFALLLAGCSPSFLVSPARYSSPQAAVQPRRALVSCHGGMAEAAKATGFVQTEMRGAAMKLHTRDQSREGEQKAQTPVAQWEPGRADYLRFLVDSRVVYQCFETLVEEYEELAQYRSHGLERGAALDADIAWFAEQGLETPAVGSYGTDYVALLRELVAEGRWEVREPRGRAGGFVFGADARMAGWPRGGALATGARARTHTHTYPCRLAVRGRPLRPVVWPPSRPCARRSRATSTTSTLPTRRAAG